MEDYTYKCKLLCFVIIERGVKIFLYNAVQIVILKYFVSVKYVYCVCVFCLYKWQNSVHLLSNCKKFKINTYDIVLNGEN